MCSITKTQSEYMRLGGKLPNEVLEHIKAYAEPRYKISWHFKAMNTLFKHQKNIMMPCVIAAKYPELNHMLLRTRFNKHYRNAQRKYRRQSIGEIYEEIYEEISFTPLLKRDILAVASSLKFEVDDKGSPIVCDYITLNRYSFTCEIVIVILTMIPVITACVSMNTGYFPRLLLLLHTSIIHYIIATLPTICLFDWEILEELIFEQHHI